MGLSQSSIDLEYALRYVESCDAYQSLPIMLYGHSWGGYAVTSVNNNPHPIAAIVSVAGFEQSSNVIKDKGRYVAGPFIHVLMPYVNLYECIRFGKSAAYTGADGLSKTSAKVLIIHSDDDPIVSYEENFMKYKKAFENDPRFTFISLSGHGHNAILSADPSDTVDGLRQLDEELIKVVVKFYDDSLASL